MKPRLIACREEREGEKAGKEERKGRVEVNREIISKDERLEKERRNDRREGELKAESKVKWWNTQVNEKMERGKKERKRDRKKGSRKIEQKGERERDAKEKKE